MSGLVDGLAYLLSPWPCFFMLLGTVLGISVGSIPGLTGSMLIALLLPLTFYMDSLHAIVLLVSIYTGAVSGGLISATLLRMPGTPAAVMTTLDGFPMAHAGRPGRALGIGITASFVGGLIGWAFLATLAPPLSRLAVQFGPFEYFSMVLMALVLIASVGSGSLLRGLFSGFLGVLVSLPGLDQSAGTMRLTFGFTELTGGFHVLPVLIGLFAVSQVLNDVVWIERRVERVAFSLQGLFLSLHDWTAQAGNLLRSSLIGTWIGILPGIGPNVGSVVAYTAARTLSKTPERFGTGTEEGIVAAEASNNAAVGGSLIPLITMGIPGSVIDALLIGALIIHDIQPGPLLFINNADMAYTMIAVCLVSNIAMYAIMLTAVRPLAALVHVPKAVLLPIIMVCCVTGVFAFNNRIFDVGVMLAFGVVGFVLERAGIPLAPFVIGLILAPIAEHHLRSGLMLSAGSWWPLVTRPVSAGLMAVSLACLVWPIVRTARRRFAEPAPTAPP